MPPLVHHGRDSDKTCSSPGARHFGDDADMDALVVVINVENSKAHIAKVAPASGTPPPEVLSPLF